MSSEGLVERARSFAERVHVGQIRKNKAQEPFINHPHEAAELVWQSGGSEAEIAGAWLHDSVEDTPTTLAEIVACFGEEVGAIVDGMTDPPDFEGLPMLERKSRQALRVISKSASVKRVKLADQISNVRSVAVDPPLKWDRQKCVDYIEGARRVAQQCWGVSEFLDQAFKAAHQNATQVYSDEPKPPR